MGADSRFPKAAWFLSFLLGQMSALLGLALAVGWTFAFALIVPQKAVGWASGMHAQLPLEPPLIGFALGALGLLFARWSREPIARYAVAGLILNALPLVLALLSRVLGSTS